MAMAMAMAMAGEDRKRRLDDDVPPDTTPSKRLQLDHASSSSSSSRLNGRHGALKDEQQLEAEAEEDDDEDDEEKVIYKKLEVRTTFFFNNVKVEDPMLICPLLTLAPAEVPQRGDLSSDARREAGPCSRRTQAAHAGKRDGGGGGANQRFQSLLGSGEYAFLIPRTVGDDASYVLNQILARHWLLTARGRRSVAGQG